MGIDVMTAASGPRFRLRLRHLLMAALVIAGIVLLRAFVPAPAGPAVTEVAIEMPPNSALSPTRVRNAVATVIHGGLLQVPLGAVRAAVQALPWVARASVRRSWPNAITVHIVLEHPVAHWGRHSLVDARGHVFQPRDIAARFQKLPVLSGVPGSESDVLADFDRARALLRRRGLKLRAFAENSRGDVHIVLDGGLAVALGREDPLGRLARFVNIAVPALGTRLGDAASIDMRYPSGFAVGWKGDGDHGKEN